MGKLRQYWFLGALLMIVLLAVPLWLFLPHAAGTTLKDPWSTIDRHRAHLDHTAFFTQPFQDPRAVTRACLECHPDAAKELMKTTHWNWEGEAVQVAGHAEPIKIGKKNLVNNFCIGIQGNWAGCTSCHAGYGWDSASYDFSKAENVDCLVCHDSSGSYAKGEKGLPLKEVNLLVVAQKVSFPRRENCGVCHIYGGGGMGVKHGDLDNTLVNPTADIDVHMGETNLLCIDCHITKEHNITGKAFSVSVTHENGIECTDCHDKSPHKDRRINAHLATIACQTCHIPTYAKKAPTKTDWDWSKAGDPNRPDDVHTYLKIKGEFIYKKNIVPQYAWFNLQANRYILGDKIDPTTITYLNKPMGNITDKNSKIWPFKLHRAKQPYDTVNNTLMIPVTSGEGGFWHEFNWDKAIRLGAEITKLPYSGQYGFATTYMQWPLSHMVSPAHDALKCCDCHGEKSRMDWKALGYEGDPEKIGGRFENQEINDEEEKEL